MIGARVGEHLNEAQEGELLLDETVLSTFGCFRPTSVGRMHWHTKNQQSELTFASIIRRIADQKDRVYDGGFQWMF